MASSLALAALTACATTPPSATARTSNTVTAPGVEISVPEAAVAADHAIASAAGVEMLRQGGNAVDAAVAASFCLSVVRPYSCGIGGGGFMMIYVPPDGHGAPARSVAINYRETAPATVGPDYFVRLALRGDRLASRYGVHASGVPGTTAGLLHVLERHGTLDRRTVLEPAIRVAEGGFAADAHYIDAVNAVRERLEEQPELVPGAAYIWRQLCHEGRARIGSVIENPEQARALRLIAEHGVDAFYRGPIARALVDVIAAGGGAITAEDLAGYRPVTMTPLRGDFGDCAVLCMPPPSSGGIAMLQVLGILERWGHEPFSGAGPTARGWPHNGPRYVHLLTEAMKHAFADRAEWLADPAFVPVPSDALLASPYLDDRAAAIVPGQVQPPMSYGSVASPAGVGGTSHLSVIDAGGMAVACTETINLRFGSLVSVPGYGFALNNEMDDFTTDPDRPNAFGLRQSERNLPAPGKRPLSSMSPTIVVRHGRAILTAGASGGPRIITGTLQVILNCLLYDMDPGEAVVASPRFHHQWMPDRLDFEERWTDDATIAAVETFGHPTGRRRSVGEVQIIRAGDDGLRAASDPRKGGAPAGF